MVMLKNNKIKEKILAGGKVMGTFYNLASVQGVEILAECGIDCVVIDGEHGPVDVETASNLIIAAENRDLTPFVRVKDFQRNSILRMLDAGAMGLIIPFIKSMDEVRALVGYGKYWPLGERGCGWSRKANFGLEPMLVNDIQEYLRWSNENTLLIPQCETLEALGCIEEMAALDGVDGIFLGPFDLSVSMGIPTQFSHPDFLAAQDRVIKACKVSNKFSFTIATSPEQAKEKFEKGYDGVMAGGVTFLANGAKGYVNGVKKLGY